MKKRWAGVATTIAVVSTLLTANGVFSAAKADNSQGETWTLYATGDIASPNSGADELNAILVKNGINADPDHTRVAMLGDGAYPDGSLLTYQKEYGKPGSWGDFKDKTYPAPGNHDYGKQMGPSDDGYRQYWNDQLTAVNGDHGETSGNTLADQSGWYSVDIGPYWHLISLNWACSNGVNTSGGSMSGCGPNDPQGLWLAGDLQKAKAANKHIIAMWHGARFFSQNDNGTPDVNAAAAQDDPGPSTDAAKTNTYWDMLHQAGADFVMAGHHHNYEVFDHMSTAEPAGAPAGDHQGTVDPTGPREFVVGTGGGEPALFTTAPPATGSIKRIDHNFGVLKLTLHANSYEWDFLSSGSPNEPAAGTVLDHGTDNTLMTIAGVGDGTTPTTTGTTPTTTNTSPPAPGNRSGYWMVGADGKVYGFGTAQKFGDAGLLPGTAAVDLEPTPSGNGYWVVDDGGGVSSFGDAVFHGAPDSLALKPGEKVTSLSSTVTGQGYWMFTNQGRVLTFGDAVSYGDMSGKKLNAPVLDSIVTPSGKGYYMVASDGGIFSFGDAAFHGSMGDKKLNAPVQSLVPTADGTGYWLVASDGGIFAFGAPFKGSMGGQKLNKPVTGMVRYADGYLMVGEDGGIFNFSSQPFLGSLGDKPPARPIVSVAALG
ncbi:MAG TPA: metallophosphoesterase [Acidimicrobiia bacterium]|nr:metallophosphoesterase [Acidimicrobiia bacterium]